MAKKILVIDDDPNIVDYLVVLFKDNGYETCSATDGVEGLDKVKTEKPDLITLDLDMPERWGTIMHRRLKKSEEIKDIPVIVISGLERKFPIRKKVMHYLGKPFDRNELLAIVQRTIGEGASA
ncbi:MAG: response regulator [Deltaproteobacteria bacterium]|nr:response regulator [Deltaproteobacteria bacterium]MBW2053110.1 response regulator [Deltaproteobacteria bacterium]MBW2141443.1 response regulator [Deltaproteobacteria bacterium]MBW2323719.1 response regulator [Deltaproteobacteria bacterium]